MVSFNLFFNPVKTFLFLREKGLDLVFARDLNRCFVTYERDYCSSTTAPTSKPRAKKSVSKAKPKVVRGANGRFVSTTTKKKATKKA